MLLQLDVDTGPYERLLERLIDSIDCEREPFQLGALKAMDAYMQSMRQRFDLFSARGGDWPEHAPSTIRRRGAGAPILNETGQLRESLDRDSASHVTEIDSDGITEGTSDRTARYHQDGTPRMPDREILVKPTDDTLEHIREALVEALQRSVDAAMF